MADRDLTTLTPDATFSWSSAFVVGADSQVAADPSIYQASAMLTALQGEDLTLTGAVTVPAATVTAHEAALTITESQISDLGSYLVAADIAGLQTQDAFLDDIAALTDPGADRLLFWDDSASEIAFLTAGPGLSIAAATISAEVVHGIAASDETTDLTTGAGKATFRLPHAMTLTAVRASVTTAPVGSAITVDINEGGSSILSTEITIDAGEKTSTTAATPAVISDASLADDAEITIDIDAVGSSTAGAGLKVYLIGTRA